MKLVLVGALDNARLSDGHVQSQLDAAVRVGGAQPACLATVGGGSEADLVVTSLGCGEREAATGTTLLRNYTVVAAEELLFSSLLEICPDVTLADMSSKGSVTLTYINRDHDADIIVFPPRLPVVIVFLCCVVSNDQCVFWKLFVETFLGGAVEVEVESLGDLSQGAQGQEREERSHVYCLAEANEGP